MIQPTKFRIHSRRCGVVLMFALVALIVASTILLAVLKTVAVQHRRIEASMYQEQARWLAESGLEKAALQLSQNADYTGESWTIAADKLDGVHSGLVVVTVEPGESPGRVAIRSQAQFPSADPTGAKYTVAAAASPKSTN